MSLSMTFYPLLSIGSRQELHPTLQKKFNRDKALTQSDVIISHCILIDSIISFKSTAHIKQGCRFTYFSVPNIRIHPACEGGIEKFALRIAVWHHEACRVMTNGDHEGRIFLSHPHTNNGFFFLLAIKYHILCLKKAPRSS